MLDQRGEGEGARGSKPPLQFVAQGLLLPRLESQMARGQRALRMLSIRLFALEQPHRHRFVFPPPIWRAASTETQKALCIPLRPRLIPLTRPDSILTKLALTHFTESAPSAAEEQYSTERKNMQNIALVLVLLALIGGSQAQDEKKAAADDSEKLAQKYLETFEKTGVPTSGAVKAAVSKAKKENTIEAWELAARLANTYANVVDVLREHYSNLYHAFKSWDKSRAESCGKRAREYEVKRLVFLGLRNEAYLDLAQLHLEKGHKSLALSYAMTAVRLSGLYPNERGEDLIKKIIEYE